MDLRQLEIFRAVAASGSLSRAADVLHVPQPALSRQVKALETTLGTPLFVRTGRGMALTDAGHELMRQSAGVIAEVRRLHDSMRSFDGVPRGEVVVGCVPTVGERIAGPLAERVIRELPEVSLRLVEGYSGHLVNWMHRGDLDLAVIYRGDERPHVQIEDLGREPLLAVGATGWWPEENGEVSFEHLASRPVSLPSTGHGLRSIIDSAARRTGVELDVVLQADSYRVLLDVVERGLAATVLPASAMVGRAGRFSTARLVEPALERGLAIARPVGNAQTLAISAVHGLLRARAAELLGTV